MRFPIFLIATGIGVYAYLYFFLKLFDIRMVVNCYFFCTFARSFTTIAQRYCDIAKLWIATFFVPLHVLLQPSGYGMIISCGCELLLFLYLCTFFYNFSRSILCRIHVVNCYFFCTFARSFTTPTRWLLSASRCELLLFLYLCTFFYNQHQSALHPGVVVNCYFFCTFARSFTTARQIPRLRSWLWIATFFVPLHVLLQHIVPASPALPCCELLLFLYLCTFFYNEGLRNPAVEQVVNCYFFCTFARSFTTPGTDSWHAEGCELLLFLYLCTFFYNWRRRQPAHRRVVNCYFFCTFARSFTTGPMQSKWTQRFKWCFRTEKSC